MNMAQLTLTVFSAEGLHEHGKIKKQDPYVIVEIGERTFKTKADRSSGPNPVWNEELQCEVPSGVTTANFTLHDHNYLVRDDVIGVARYDFTNSRGQEETIPVYSKTGEPAGAMRIRALYQGSGSGASGNTAGAQGATAAGLTGAGRGAGQSQTGVYAGQNQTGERAAAAGAGIGAGSGIANQTGTGMGTGAGTGHGTAVALDTDAATGAGMGAGMGTRGINEPTAGTTRMGAVEGTARGMPGFVGEMNRGPTCNQEFFVVEEDRPIVKEVKQYVREHHPVEREMVKQTMTTGREMAMETGPTELVDTQERVVETTIPKPCP